MSLSDLKLLPISLNTSASQPAKLAAATNDPEASLPPPTAVPAGGMRGHEVDIGHVSGREGEDVQEEDCAGSKAAGSQGGSASDERADALKEVRP